MQKQSCGGKSPDASLLMFGEKHPVYRCSSGRICTALNASGRPQRRHACEVICFMSNCYTRNRGNTGRARSDRGQFRLEMSPLSPLCSRALFLFRPLRQSEFYGFPHDAL